MVHTIYAMAMPWQHPRAGSVPWQHHGNTRARDSVSQCSVQCTSVETLRRVFSVETACLARSVLRRDRRAIGMSRLPGLVKHPSNHWGGDSDVDSDFVAGPSRKTARLSGKQFAVVDAKDVDESKAPLFAKKHRQIYPVGRACFHELAARVQRTRW